MYHMFKHILQMNTTNSGGQNLKSSPIHNRPLKRDHNYKPFLLYSNKKETSDFHGTVSFDPVKILQQK